MSEPSSSCAEKKKLKKRKDKQQGILRYINFRLGHAGSGVMQKTHFSIRSTCFFFLFTKKTINELLFQVLAADMGRS